MSYEYLKDKFGKILILDISDNKPEIRIDITAFKIKEMKGKHVEFVQYVAFIYLKLREFNSNNNTLCTMKIELKDTGIKNFSPTFLRKVLSPINQLVNSDDVEVLDKIYVYNLNKYVKQIWKGVSKFFDPITVAKFVIVN